MKHIEINFKNAFNIGNEYSTKDNAFTFSFIEDCKLNSQALEKVTFLHHKQQNSPGNKGKTGLLLCCNTL